MAIQITKETAISTTETDVQKNMTIIMTDSEKEMVITTIMIMKIITEIIEIMIIIYVTSIIMNGDVTDKIVSIITVIIIIIIIYARTI